MDQLTVLSVLCWIVWWFLCRDNPKSIESIALIFAGFAFNTLLALHLWMRFVILRDSKGLSQKELDFLLDDNSNTIGAMLMHLAATERYYQRSTFSGVPKAKMDFGKEMDTEAKAWKTIWSAGQGVTNIDATSTVSELVDKLKSEFSSAIEEQKKLLEVYPK